VFNDELCLCADESHWDMDERLLLQRLVYETVDMNEICRYCTDTTQLGRVCSLLCYVYCCIIFALVNHELEDILLSFILFLINKMQSEMADYKPVQPPGKLDETYTPSLILARLLHCVKTYVILIKT